jgi:hypothetical protein
MGLFDFLKPKPSEEPSVTPNQYVILELQKRLRDMGYKAELSTKYIALIVNDQLEIATAIIENPDYHPSIFHLLAIAIHPTYFPNGIEENVVGIGNQLSDKTASVLDNYIGTTFSAIIDCFSDVHNPALDFTDHTGVLWHPKSGDTGYQGKWEHRGADPFELVKETLKNKLPDQKINWLKLYTARQADGSMTAECLLNNEVWDEGRELLMQYARTWPQKGEFLGQKQFIMIRRCDAHDPK